MGRDLFSPLTHRIVQRIATYQKRRENEPKNAPRHGKNDNKMGTGLTTDPRSSFPLSSFSVRRLRYSFL